MSSDFVYILKKSPIHPYKIALYTRHKKAPPTLAHIYHYTRHASKQFTPPYLSPFTPTPTHNAPTPTPTHNAQALAPRRAPHPYKYNENERIYERMRMAILPLPRIFREFLLFSRTFLLTYEGYLRVTFRVIIEKKEDKKICHIK